ncbi:MAG: hypothetical protein LBJ95_00055 [Oscillospiraceae bacterium]|nr:hypothetical protein [Oscillospiraceae bacterium]
MAKDIINAVKDAELNAQRLEQSANNKADLIIGNAHKEAQNLLESKLKEGKNKANLQLEITNRKIKEYLKKAQEDAVLEAEKMKEQIKEKKSTVVKRIIEQVLSN